jgi:hypothetical protein
VPKSTLSSQEPKLHTPPLPQKDEALFAHTTILRGEAIHLSKEKLSCGHCPIRFDQTILNQTPDLIGDRLFPPTFAIPGRTRQRLDVFSCLDEQRSLAARHSPKKMKRFLHTPPHQEAKLFT